MSESTWGAIKMEFNFLWTLNFFLPIHLIFLLYVKTELSFSVGTHDFQASDVLASHTIGVILGYWSIQIFLHGQFISNSVP